MGCNFACILLFSTGNTQQFSAPGDEDTRCVTTHGLLRSFVNQRILMTSLYYFNLLETERPRGPWIVVDEDGDSPPSVCTITLYCLAGGQNFYSVLNGPGKR